MKRKPAIRTEVEPTLLTNIKKGHKRPPEGQSWQAFLFTQEVFEGRRGEERRPRQVKFIEGSTLDERDNNIREFMEQPDVVLLDDGLELQLLGPPRKVARVTAQHEQAK